MLLVMALVGCSPAPGSAADPHGVGSYPLPSRAPDLPPPVVLRPTLAPSPGRSPAPTASPTAAVPPVGPTPSPVSGTASWYDDGPGLYAAVSSWTWGDERYDLRVCGVDWGVCVTVTVRDFCQCYVGTSMERVIDLSPDAFRKLAPLSHGLVTVTIQ